MDPYFLLMLLAAFVAGGINGVAGGGTMFTFTALGLELPLKVANATNAALLTPASVSSAFVFWRELKLHARRVMILAVPSILGAYTGAVVLQNTSDEVFRRVVPFLILFAVTLFAFKDHITAALRRGRPVVLAADAQGGRISALGWGLGVLCQFMIAFYGGYFGAGIGILMISLYSLMGMRNMHVINAIKNPMAVLMNGVAAIRFALSGLVAWPYALPMAVCAVIGGYLASRASRRINQRYLRLFVIGYGLLIAAYMFARYWLGMFQPKVQ